MIGSRGHSRRCSLRSRASTWPGGRANGNEAIRLVTTLELDVTTMDIDMPVTDGVEATRAIMESFFAAPIIVLTG